MIPINKAAWCERYLANFVDNSLLKSDSPVRYWSLARLAEDFKFNLAEQPFIIKLFLENVMRHYASIDDLAHETVVNTIKQLIANNASANFEFSYLPSRVLMQDYTGVPAIVDLAAMRDAVAAQGGDAKSINPLCPVDLVIDHSVIVDQAGSPAALAYNSQREMERNQERYQFLKWAQHSFDNLQVVPPGRGICHQVNLEYLAQVVRDEDGVLSPDTLIGTDSHTTMINGLGVLGWGVGGIEAEAVMLGQPLSIGAPQVVGVNLQGKLPVGITATDLVLTVTETLRKHGVVGKYVEFYGAGMLSLSIADRATVANMSPEYGATCGVFPIDSKVTDYLKLTNRSPALIARVEAYAKAQQLWYDNPNNNANYSDNIYIDLSAITPSVAGPKRPQDRIALNEIKQATQAAMALSGQAEDNQAKADSADTLASGDIVLAAITSCTNTSNPHVMLQAGLLAKAAVERGLSVPAHVKASLAPGSQVVARYLDSTELQPYLDKLGFNRIGFGCTTCIGNSGPLNGDYEQQVQDHNLSVCSVLSGNRNFEGRIHPSVRLNWLTSPPLVVAFALVGHTRINFDEEPIGTDNQGQAVYLADIWPSEDMVNRALSAITQESYAQSYQDMLVGDDAWERLPTSNSICYDWDSDSTYIVRPPFLDALAENTATAAGQANAKEQGESLIESARILALLGDSITTDHISPAGQINAKTPAGQYLIKRGVEPKHFNSYGTRRGHHEVMVRGTFANNRLQNQIVTPSEGGLTRIFDSAEFDTSTEVSIFEASQYYQQNHIPLVIFAGKEYGTGSSRDWAAKGCQLLGVKAVIAQSFERIHRSNLVGMGIMPLLLPSTMSVADLKLTGQEKITLAFANEEHSQLAPGQPLRLLITNRANDHQATAEIVVTLNIINDLELKYFHAGGVLPYVAREFI
ncbi:aconitate hydratase [Colwellia chukchiensis]|uniref:Aconitate hydratase n=1 Tax=Colwellia chukchiensis TaxID=641665 RepID=A0A1H7Q8I6_9GAMM|nr:aconitate hydratase AcnA [Colwellia chukchiensis]SEL44109.1 aconitate hydratase [Colwellia chukchiensis]